MELIEVIEARHVAGYRVWIRLSDGVEGDLDLEGELYGEVFEPLRDLATFRSLRVDLGTVTWPNGADLAPDFLYAQLRATSDTTATKN